MSDFSVTTPEFSVGTRETILARFRRCALCCALPLLLHYCHILDGADKEGSKQCEFGSKWLLIPRDYSRAGPSNGMALCPTCHLAYLTGNPSDALVSFVPCSEILQYLLECITDLKGANVDELLDDLRSNPAETEAAKKAKPFVDCFELYITPALSADSIYYIPTQYLPSPCKLDVTGTSFISTENDTVVPGSTFRIFETKSISQDDTAPSFANIHIHPSSQVNPHTDLSRLLWRMEGCSAGAFLTFLAPIVLPNFNTHKPKLLDQLLDKFLKMLISVLEQDPPRNDAVKNPAVSQRKKYMAPEPESTPSEIVPDHEMAMWRFGPQFSANDVIRMETGVFLPRPWHQYRPKDGDPVPLRV